MESLLLSCRALSSPTTCRFIPAHTGPGLPPGVGSQFVASPETVNHPALPLCHNSTSGWCRVESMVPGRVRIFLTVAAFCAAPLPAQRSASVAGRILDVTGAAIPAATITVVNQETGFRRSTESSPGGAYAVTSLEPGEYTIKVAKDQFRPINNFDVPLAPQAATTIDFVLQVGSVFEEIRVEGIASPIDRPDASVGGQFQHDEITRIPVNGGKVLDLLGMTPGTLVTPATRGEAGQFSVNGQRPNSNYFTVDTVSANIGVTAGGLPEQSTGGTLPGVSAFGSLDALAPLESIQELQVRTSSTVAEFGRLPGAGVSLVTQSGSNGFHGATSLHLRHELFAAGNWFANQAGFGRLPSRLGDLTQTFGGPLRRNRTFFFLSYEWLMLRQAYVWVQPTPSIAARQAAAGWAQPALGFFPMPNAGQLTGGIGEWVGGSVLPAGLDTGTARVDQAVGSRASLFARFSDSPSTNQFGNLGIDHLDLRVRSLTAGLDAHPTPNLATDLRLNETETTAHSSWSGSVAPLAPPPQGADTVGPPPSSAPDCVLQPMVAAFLNSPAPCDYLVRFTIGGVGQLVYGPEGDRTQRQFQAVDSVALKRKKHSLGFGADYRAITAIREDAGNTLGVISDSVADLTSMRNLWVFTVTPGASGVPAAQTVKVQELSLWALDTWQPAPRLTVSAGLRWEFSPAPVPTAADLAANLIFFYDPASGITELATQPRPLWPTSYGDFAPRLGLAYRLTADGGTVLRAGGGLYYDSSLSIATDILNGGPLSAGKFTSQRYAPFSTVLGYGFMPNLKLPEIRQWNVALEHAFGARDTLSVGYVGSSGWSLIRREMGGVPGDSLTKFVALTTNHGLSDYQSLQVHYRRHFTRGLDIAASYTWSHSMDNDSSDAFLVWAGAGSPAANDWGPSDFDLRHSFTASAVYELGRAKDATAPHGWLAGWAASGILRARTGFHITVQQAEEYDGIGVANAFRPNLVASQPLWMADPSAPGGRRLNPAAFQNTAPGVQGNLGRNAIGGFGMSQFDVALGREFTRGGYRSLQLRLEAFNLFNTPSFADPVKFMDNPLFGQSTSMLNMMLGSGSPGSGLAPMLQAGGPRAFQASLRLRF